MELTARIITADDEKIGSISIGKYIAILSTHPPGLLRKKHKHDETHVIFVRKGKMRYNIEGDCKEVSSGDVVVISPGVHHSSMVLGEGPSNVMCLVLL